MDRGFGSGHWSLALASSARAQAVTGDPTFGQHRSPAVYDG